MARVLKWSALAIAVAIGVAAALYVPPLRASVGAGAGFVAKQMCSCVFVAERDFDSCRPDMMEVMDEIHAEVVDEPASRGVRASVSTFFVERFARYDDGFGCTLE